MKSITYNEEKNVNSIELFALYNDAGWKAYTSKPENATKMRIWSIHPKYLDSKGLVALWRREILPKQ